jgi:hypothetical protein
MDLNHHQALQVRQLKVGSLNRQLVHFHPLRSLLVTSLPLKVDSYRVFSNVDGFGKGVSITSNNGLGQPSG